MIEHIRGLYFSGHHLTRDLVGYVAPLTAFMALVIASFGPAQNTAVVIFRDYLLAASIRTFILALIVYVLVGWFIGSVVAFTANAMHRYLTYLPRLGSKFSYAYWYNQDAADIDALYKKIFPEYQYFASGAAVTPTDRVNVLKEYLRRYNPEGFAEAYRQFMKVDVVRATIFYSAAILAYESYLFVQNLASGISYVSWPLALISAFILTMTLVELPRRTRKVVRTEYEFIIATARIRDDVVAGIQPLV